MYLEIFFCEVLMKIICNQVFGGGMYELPTTIYMIESREKFRTLPMNSIH